MSKTKEFSKIGIYSLLTMTDDLLRAEREANRRLREEQEREYEESAAKDRARIKERRRLESERQEAVERELQKERQVCRMNIGVLTNLLDLYSPQSPIDTKYFHLLFENNTKQRIPSVQLILM